MISFSVPGIPATKGSYRAIPNRRGGVFVSNANPRCSSWEASVAYCAKAAGVRMSEKPMRVRLWFLFSRPNSHFGAKGLRSVADPHPTTRRVGDIDKLARAVLDGLTGVVWADDSQVVSLCAAKVWGQEPGLRVEIEEM